MEDDAAIRGPGVVATRLIRHRKRGVAVRMKTTSIQARTGEEAPFTGGQLLERECPARCEIRIGDERDAPARVVSLQQAAETDGAAKPFATRMMGEQVEGRRLKQQIERL